MKKILMLIFSIGMCFALASCNFSSNSITGSDDYASLVRPVKELKGYQKVSLKANESKKVSFEITEDMLRFWTASGKLDAESGSFTVWVSNSSNVKDGVQFTILKIREE